MLYSDGDMIFQTGNIADSTKTLINEYSTEFINSEYSSYQNVSWYTNRNNIINVSFKNEVSFNTMKYWFYNASNLKYVNYSNFDINSVTSMYYTYANCTNLTGSPVCGNNVTNMANAYYNCRNLTGSPVCGNKVTDISSTYYNCYNLTGSPVCGNNVTNMYATYRNCRNLSGDMYCHNENIVSFTNCFYNKNNSRRINIYVPLDSVTTNSILVSNSSSIVGQSITWTTDTSNKCYYNSTYNIYVYPTLGFSIDGIENKYMAYSSNVSISIGYSYYMDDTIPTFNVTSSDTSVATINDITVENNKLNFNIYSNNLDGKTTITVTGEVTSLKGVHYLKTIEFKVGVNETGEAPAIRYEVTNIEGAQYGFELNSNGYYESQNAGINSSYSICKINLISDGSSTLYLDCINSGENNYDYGILSNVDETLSLSYSADSSYFKSFKGLSSTSVQTVDYGVLEAGEHFIYVKYRKDSSASSGNDSLQFKVRLE